VTDGDVPAPAEGAELAGIVAELYGLAPAEFVARRDERAGEARKAKHRDLARAVKALRKPAASAWLANVLVRERREQVDRLLDLGAAMRAAQSQLSADDLRHLGRQRQQVVAALVGEARDLAAGMSHSVNDTVLRALAGTLEAALAEEEAGDLLRAGALTQPLEYAGFALAGTDDKPDGHASPSPPATTPAAPDTATTSEPTVGDPPDGADAAEAAERAAEEEAQRRQETIAAAEASAGAGRAAAVKSREAADAAARDLAEVEGRQRIVAANLADLESRRRALQQEEARLEQERSTAAEAERVSNDSAGAAEDRATLADHAFAELVDDCATDAHAASDRNEALDPRHITEELHKPRDGDAKNKGHE
jgi:hypothetical protein